MNQIPSIGSRWRHYKSSGGEDYTYIVLGIVIHSETSESMVLYKPLYDVPLDSWAYGYDAVVRPLSIWYDVIEYQGKHIQRFVEIVGESVDSVAIDGVTTGMHDTKIGK